MNRLLRKLLVCLLAVTVSWFGDSADAQVRVRGYTRKDGTYVAPHYRSRPDGNFWNNWSTAGNVNPYTGKVGTKTSPPANYGGDVYVRGYVRSDGTYVAPHMRSAPDGNFHNNWSTKGNYNPYTGEAGTKVSPPANYGGGNESFATSTSALSSRNAYQRANEDRRKEAASSVGALGHDVDWRDHDWGHLNDMKMRIEKANQIAALGETVDWKGYSWTDLNQIKERIEKSLELRRMGEYVNWRDHSVESLDALKRRAQLAGSYSYGR